MLVAKGQTGHGSGFEKERGYNPFKYGMVRGADVHSGYQGNEEFNFHGGHGTVDYTPKRRLNPHPHYGTSSEASCERKPKACLVGSGLIKSFNRVSNPRS